MNRRKLISIVAAILAIIMILSLLLSIIPAVANAAGAEEIRQELEALKDEAAQIRSQRKELEQQQAENEAETEDVIQRKRDIDDQIKLVHDEIGNINSQIQTYNALIAQQQTELDEAISVQALLSERYATRIRAMEKSSHTSYWSILFRSESFADFLTSIHMMSEIAQADKEMMTELESAALRIKTAQEQLAAEKQGLSQQRAALEESQAELETLNAEATLLLDELNDNALALKEMHEAFLAQEAELSDKIAQREKDYQNAIAPPVSGNGEWLYPLPYRVPITDAYGWRWHVITGKYSFHHGVDFAARAGTAIYASRSGTVTDASDDDIYGYNVTINHGDGYSSLYAHMTHYVVSDGDYVEQGQIIGYVGSTGWSSGPHLHFSIYYRGSSVNPMDYL